MRLDKVSPVHLILEILPQRLIRAHTEQQHNHKRRRSGREEQARPSSQKSRRQGLVAVQHLARAHELDGPVGERISGDDEEDGDTDGALVGEADDGQSPEVVVLVVGAPAALRHVGGVEEMEDEDAEGGGASHAVEVRRGVQLGGSDLCAGFGALQEAGLEEMESVSYGSLPGNISIDCYQD